MELDLGYYFNEIRCLEKISCSSIIVMKYVFQTELTYNLVLERGVNDLYHFLEGLEYSADRLDKIVKDLNNYVDGVIKDKNKSNEIIKLAIKRMIPNGPLGKKQLSNCKIFAGENHSHEAQQPKKIDFNKFNLKNSKR